MAKITASTKMTVNSPRRIPVQDLKEFLENIPDKASVSITSYSGDQRDPGYTLIEATWEL